jgi:hypothetical protein
VQLLAELLLLLVYKSLKVRGNESMIEFSSSGCMLGIYAIYVLTQDIPETVNIRQFGISKRKGDDESIEDEQKSSF